MSGDRLPHRIAAVHRPGASVKEGFGGSLSYEVAASETNTTTVGCSEENKATNSNAYTRAQSHASSQNETCTGGLIQSTATLKNIGHIAFTEARDLYLEKGWPQTCADNGSGTGSACPLRRRGQAFPAVNGCAHRDRATNTVEGTAASNPIAPHSTEFCELPDPIQPDPRLTTEKSLPLCCGHRQVQTTATAWLNAKRRDED